MVIPYTSYTGVLIVFFMSGDSFNVYSVKNLLPRNSVCFANFTPGYSTTRTLPRWWRWNTEALPVFIFVPLYGLLKLNNRRIQMRGCDDEVCSEMHEAERSRRTTRDSAAYWREVALAFICTAYSGCRGGSERGRDRCWYGGRCLTGEDVRTAKGRRAQRPTSRSSRRGWEKGGFRLYWDSRCAASFS